MAAWSPDVLFALAGCTCCCACEAEYPDIAAVRRASCYHRYLNPHPQIVVLDAGGQYCHLIARKVRDLGVYAEVRPSESPGRELAGARGIIISGGPISVYDPAAPRVDPAIFACGSRCWASATASS